MLILDGELTFIVDYLFIDEAQLTTQLPTFMPTLI